MQAIEFIPREPLEAEQSISSFVGYNKVQGMLRCRALGLPTLPGIVVDPARADLNAVLTAAKTIDPAQYLIRHDRSPEIGSYPQGGYIVGIEDIPEELAWYRELGRIVVLFAPAHPLDNLYSASGLITSDNILQIEVVGPGFDASDLNRGMISPLESHRFAMDEKGRTRRLESTRVERGAYPFMKSLRIRKIALKFILMEHSFNVENIGDDEARALLRADSRAHKKQIRHLLSEEDYVVAPASFLSQLTGFARTISTLMNLRALGENMVAFSASQIDDGAKTVVWDLILPRRKYALT